jgi:hypothetical protein
MSDLLECFVQLANESFSLSRASSKATHLAFVSCFSKSTTREIPDIGIDVRPSERRVENNVINSIDG